MTQPGAQLSGMFHVGITVLHHPAVEPPVADVSPTPHPKKLMLLDSTDCLAWMARVVMLSAHSHGLDARPGLQGGGDGLAARGEMCMGGATNLVGEAAEASLAGG